MILDQSRNKGQQDLQLSTNLTRVFVLYITPPKVQNEDPVKIVLKLLEIKGVDRPSTNPTSAWYGCYDLCSFVYLAGFSFTV